VTVASQLIYQGKLNRQRGASMGFSSENCYSTIYSLNRFLRSSVTQVARQIVDQKTMLASLAGGGIHGG
jgi:hypothetical protein